ncbi:hypothetical protein ATANTOWER_017582, partial [Ataeniobius toweri]|nr:hypothetical protein [Ataeniobius toweri]
LSANIQEKLVVKQEVPGDQSPGVNHEDPEIFHIKEEHEERQHDVKDQTDANRFPLAAALVKSQDDEEKPLFSELHQIGDQDLPTSSSAEQMKAEPDEEDYVGAESYRKADLNTHGDTCNSSETEDSKEDDVNHPDCGSETEDSNDDWKESRTQTGRAQLTAVHSKVEGVCFLHSNHLNKMTLRMRAWQKRKRELDLFRRYSDDEDEHRGIENNCHSKHHECESYNLTSQAEDDEENQDLVTGSKRSRTKKGKPEGFVRSGVKLPDYPAAPNKLQSIHNTNILNNVCSETKPQITFWKPSPALQDLKRRHPAFNMQAQLLSAGTSQCPDLSMQYQVVQGMKFLMVITTGKKTGEDTASVAVSFFWLVSSTYGWPTSMG